MPKPLLFFEAAADKARQAWLWYEERSARAAQRFRATFEGAVADIQNHPDGMPEYLHGTRMLKLKRFPYLLVYRETNVEIQIIAVAHAHRRSGYWKQRVK